MSRRASISARLLFLRAFHSASDSLGRLCLNTHPRIHSVTHAIFIKCVQSESDGFSGL